MSPELVITIGKETAYTVLLIGGPMLIIAMIVGITITIFQTVTQIRDQTLTFIPKIVAILVALIFFLPFMIQTLIAYSIKIFTLGSQFV
ncbi:MAG: flagellar biosynthesis protein FliQ [Candidatus Aureabacteria bacterium]|nr:flagellar biosynthesis protein FliQ [Candidatus Auribacterota bacterium]